MYKRPLSHHQHFTYPTHIYKWINTHLSQIKNAITLILILAISYTTGSIITAMQNPTQLPEIFTTDTTSQTLKVEPLYQLVRPGDGDFLAAYGGQQRDDIITTYDFKFESLIGYLPSEQQSETVPLYRMYKGGDIGVHAAAAGTDRKSAYEAHGFGHNGNLGYIYTTQKPGTVPLYQLYNCPGDGTPKADYIVSTEANLIKYAKGGYPNGTDTVKAWDVFYTDNGPCVGKQEGECVFDAYDQMYDPNQKKYFLWASIGPTFWAYSRDASTNWAWKLSGGRGQDLATEGNQVFRAPGGPCHNKAAGECKFDILNRYYDSKNHATAMHVFIGTDLWYWHTDHGQANYNWTLYQGRGRDLATESFQGFRDPGGPCHGKAAGQCQFDTFTQGYDPVNRRYTMNVSVGDKLYAWVDRIDAGHGWQTYHQAYGNNPQGQSIAAHPFYGPVCQGLTPEQCHFDNLNIFYDMQNSGKDQDHSQMTGRVILSIYRDAKTYQWVRLKEGNALGGWSTYFDHYGSPTCGPNGQHIESLLGYIHASDPSELNPGSSTAGVGQSCSVWDGHYSDVHDVVSSEWRSLLCFDGEYYYCGVDYDSDKADAGINPALVSTTTGSWTCNGKKWITADLYCDESITAAEDDAATAGADYPATKRRCSPEEADTPQYCRSNIWTSRGWPCRQGCVNGLCVEDSEDACTPDGNNKKCIDRTTIGVCKADGTGWKDQVACAAGELCEASTGTCIKDTAYCPTVGAKRCNPDHSSYPQVCNGENQWEFLPDGSGSAYQCANPLQCHKGVCTEADKIPECTVGEKKCSDDSTQLISCKNVAGVGGRWQPTDCPSSKICEVSTSTASATPVNSTSCVANPYYCATTATTQQLQSGTLPEGAKRCHPDDDTPQYCYQNQWYNYSSTCEDADKICVEGDCLALVCSPQEAGCKDASATAVCAADGTAWINETVCPEGQYCSEGACTDISISLNLKIKLERKENSKTTAEVSLYADSQIVDQQTVEVDEDGQAQNIVFPNISAGEYYVIVKPQGYLSQYKYARISLSEPADVTFPEVFLAGDLDDSDKVTTQDYYNLRKEFGKYSDIVQDFDGSGKINTLDFAIYRKNLTYKGVLENL